MSYGEASFVVKKGDAKKIQKIVEIPESIAAPLKKGDKVGEVKFKLGETVVGSVDAVVLEDVDKISFWGLFCRLLKGFFLSA